MIVLLQPSVHLRKKPFTFLPLSVIPSSGPFQSSSLLPGGVFTETVQEETKRQAGRHEAAKLILEILTYLCACSLFYDVVCSLSLQDPDG